MIYLKQKRFILSFIFSVLFFSPFSLSQEALDNSSELVKEDEPLFKAEGQLFCLPFGIGQYAITSDDKHFYIAANSQIKKGEGMAQELAVSQLYKGIGALVFIPLAKEKVHMDFEPNQDNPVFDAGIKHFVLLEKKLEASIDSIIGYPIIVTTKRPCEIYAFDQISFQKNLLVGSAKNIKDSNLKEISNIEKIATGPKGMIFAAVTGNSSDEFGNSGSGIALLMMSDAQEPKPDAKKDEITKKEEQKKASKKESVDAEEKKERRLKISLPQFADRSMPFNKTSAFIKIGGDLESVKVSDMYWCHHLSCLFVALQVKAGSTEGDGARALIIGRIEKRIEKKKDGDREYHVLSFRPIVPSDVFSDNQNEIIGSIGKNSEVSLHKVRTMCSSNRISYAIVLGSNGSPAKTKRSVYAIPLVDYPNEDPNKGDVAYKGCIAQEVFSHSNIRTLIHRSLRKIAQGQGSVITSDDPAARVGGSDMPYGDINDIFVFSDAVFAVVGDTDSGKTSGVFISRALFDEKGNVKRWSDWRQVLHSHENIFGAHLDASFGTFTIIKGQDSKNINTIKFTSWGNGAENGLRDLTTLLSQEFPRDFDGIQGCNEFPSLLEGLEMTLLVATGFQKIALVDMGYIDNEKLIRNVGDFSTDKQIFDSGKITRDFPDRDSKVVIISGGVLDQLGPIKASAVSVTDSGRLFVGGVEGVAVLVDEGNGKGWDLSNGLASRFEGLHNGMAFKKVGDFRFVRKLISQDQNLYVLTDTALYKIDVSDEGNNFVTGTLKTIQLASLSTIEGLSQYSTFLDFIVSNNLGLLATSLGLFRVGDWQDISHNEIIHWTRIEIPTYQGPIQQLIPVSATGLETDFAKEGKDGMLYVLGANYSKDEAQLNRFTIRSGPVTDSTVLPLPDYFVEIPGKGVGSNAYFINFGSFRKAIYFDGALRFGIKGSDLDDNSALSLLPKGIRTRTPLSIANRKKIPLGLGLGDDIVKVFRSFTGPILVAGNFGLKVNE